MPSFGWDGPVKHRWQFDLLGLALSIGKYTPVKTGALLRQVRSLHNYHLIRTDGRATGVEAEFNLPYARIQDIGGRVGAVYGQLMVWYDQDGEKVFRTSRSSFKLKGYNYTRRGLADWLGSRKGITVGWEDK